MSMAEFIPFIGLGEVESVNDDHKLYRYKVRIFNKHSPTQPETKDLPWSMVMGHTSSSSIDKVGDTPALSVGTWVVVCEISQDQYIIMGSVVGEGSVPMEAFTKTEMHKYRDTVESDNKQILGVKSPEITRDPRYSETRVIRSKSGHIIETCDRNGYITISSSDSSSYIELGTDGRVWIHGKTIAIVANTIMSKVKSLVIDADQIDIKSKMLNLTTNMSFKSLSGMAGSFIDGIATFSTKSFSIAANRIGQLSAKVLLLN